eukprot:Filipodium_phascolosomae@DN7864_c0_g1_i1.p1
MLFLLIITSITKIAAVSVKPHFERNFKCHDSSAMDNGTWAIGHGYDIHRLEPGHKLVIAGVELDHQAGTVSHSDGDVAFHSICDAIFGALKVGDIGEHFPNTDVKWKDADSSVFMEVARSEAVAHGYQIQSVDVTILLEIPKIQHLRNLMRAMIADTLFIPLSRVNIKARTNEGLDAVGEGRAVASHCVVLLQKVGSKVTEDERPKLDVSA